MDSRRPKLTRVAQLQAAIGKQLGWAFRPTIRSTAKRCGQSPRYRHRPARWRAAWFGSLGYRRRGDQYIAA
jgi:hypothetical protein